MKEGCPYPFCVLDDFHDGDHEFKSDMPQGELRLVYQFHTLGSMRCDLDPEMPAKAFYKDESGRGWALCSCCQEEYGARLTKEMQ